MRTTFFAFSVAVALLMPQFHVRADNALIGPGRGIGQTRLGPNGEFYLKKLPTADASDAGMSQNHLVWVQKTGRYAPQTLYVHTVSNGALNVKPFDGVTIDEIRVTSPFFHTRNGIHPGSDLAAIRRQFSSLHRDKNQPNVFDAPGIAFEFAAPVTPKSRCIAIDVHPRRAEGMASQEQVRYLLREGLN